MRSNIVSGFALGTEQRAIQAADYDGKAWVVAHFSPRRSAVRTFTTGSDATGAYAQASDSPTRTRLSINSPFAGMITTDAGQHAILAGAGIFLATGKTSEGTPYVELGLVRP
jgi:hypothetical protein